MPTHMPERPKDFHAKMRAARAYYEATGHAEEWHAALHLSQDTIKSYESGRRRPRDNMAGALLGRVNELTGLPAEWLWGTPETPHNHDDALTELQGKMQAMIALIVANAEEARSQTDEVLAAIRQIRSPQQR